MILQKRKVNKDCFSLYSMDKKGCVLINCNYSLFLTIENFNKSIVT